MWLIGTVIIICIALEFIFDPGYDVEIDELKDKIRDLENRKD